MRVKPLLKSVVTFYPTKFTTNHCTLESIKNVFEWALELSEASGEVVGVSMQHSLKHDEFALMVECGRKTFSSHAKTSRKVFDDVSAKIFKHIERLHASVEKEERLARTKSSRRHRR